MDTKLYDADKSTAVERAMLMCIERIDALEAKNNAFEMRNRELMNRIISTMASPLEIYLDIFAFLSGVSASSFRYWMEPNILADMFSKRTVDPVADARATELHKKFIGPEAPLLWETPTAVMRTYNLKVKLFNMVYVIEALTFDEIERYWKWRLEWTGWLERT